VSVRILLLFNLIFNSFSAHFQVIYSKVEIPLTPIQRWKKIKLSKAISTIKLIIHKHVVITN